MTTGAHRQGYHHGSLAVALVDAGLELTRAGGPTALRLRDVTRRVGVSPTAAYRHFADRDSLLAAVAEAIRHDLSDRMAGPPETGAGALDPVAALRAVGLAYIDFALREPGWFETAFAAPTAGLLAPAGPRAVAALPSPVARLVVALDGLVEAGLLTPARRKGAEWPCWSAVHGFALLALHGPLRGHPPRAVRAAAARTVDDIVAGVLA